MPKNGDKKFLSINDGNPKRSFLNQRKEFVVELGLRVAPDDDQVLHNPACNARRQATCRVVSAAVVPEPETLDADE
jgi:hypothetical protein